MSLIILFAVAGCSTYWYQEGKSFKECKQTREKCRSELLKYSDLNRLHVQYEVDFIENCMMEKGYRLVGPDDLVDRARKAAEASLNPDLLRICCAPHFSPTIKKAGSHNDLPAKNLSNGQEWI